MAGMRLSAAKYGCRFPRAGCAVPCVFADCGWLFRHARVWRVSDVAAAAVVAACRGILPLD